MPRRYSTNPLDVQPDEDLTFGDVTLLTLLVVGLSAITAVFVLGALCVDHRIALALEALL